MSRIPPDIRAIITGRTPSTPVEMVDALTVAYMHIFPEGVPGPEARRLTELADQAQALEREVAAATQRKDRP